jgi:hypothetical protein
MDFIRTELGIPAPNVLAWNSRAENSPVGAEYIMYERIPGVELYQHDEANLPLGNDPYVDILPDIQHIHSQFMTRAFSQIGNIYYKEDVPEPLRDRPLYAKDHVTTNSTRFCIGPTTDREFWRAGRASLDIDRGPCEHFNFLLFKCSDVYQGPNTHSYLLALAACARAFVDAHLDSSIRDSYRRLISDYEKLAPHIAPLQSLYMLWHPDLHAGNIIVTETTSPCKLMSIIEWENAHVAPFYLQIAPAPAYTYDEAEDEDETLPVDPPSRGDSELPGQTDVLDNNRKLRRYRSYKAILHENDPPLAKEMFDLLGVWQKRHLLSPAEAITRGDIGGLALIGQGFLICRGLWGSMVGFNEKREPLLPFPIDISKKKEERLEKEWASSLFRRNALTCNDMLEPLNMSWYREGMVSIDEYEDVKRGVEAKRQEILDAAENPEEKLRLEQEWPLQDGKVAMSADICC